MSWNQRKEEARDDNIDVSRYKKMKYLNKIDEALTEFWVNNDPLKLEWFVKAFLMILPTIIIRLTIYLHKKKEKWQR